jgi:hypothetical protein
MRKYANKQPILWRNVSQQFLPSLEQIDNVKPVQSEANTHFQKEFQLEH